MTMLLIIGVSVCWLVTVPQIWKDWLDVRKHRKPDIRAAQFGFQMWDYSDCTRDRRWCKDCDQRVPGHNCNSTYDWLVIESAMLVGVTILCVAVRWMQDR